MANGNNGNYGNYTSGPMGYPTGGQGMGYGSPRPNGNPGGKGGKGGKKKKAKKARQQAELRMQKRTMRGRQKYAIENLTYRKRVESVNGRGGIDTKYYVLPEDIKPKKRGKDYFFVMRKFVCFLMALVLLISIGVYALSYLNLEAVPRQFLALYMETEPKADDEAPGDQNEGEQDENQDENGGEDDTANADVVSIKREGEDGEGAGGDTEGGDGENTDGEGGDGENGENSGASKDFDGITYGILDPVFGFIRYVARKFDINVNLGDSPLYDQMIAKYEVGMEDPIAGYALFLFPVGLILYVVTALIMLIKAILGTFNKRIFKCFGLGSIFMIIFAALSAVGGLAFLTPIDGKMDFGSIVNVLIDGITGAGGFTAGYGMLILIGLPVVTLILSMFARKKVPYSIFDTFGE